MLGTMARPGRTLRKSRWENSAPAADQCQRPLSKEVKSRAKDSRLRFKAPSKSEGPVNEVRTVQFSLRRSRWAEYRNFAFLRSGPEMEASARRLSQSQRNKPVTFVAERFRLKYSG